MFKRYLLIASVVVVVPLTVDAAAASKPLMPTSCDSQTQRQFDFWIGNWRIKQRILRKDGEYIELPASTRVSKILNGCAILERWQGEVQFFWEGMTAPQAMTAISVRAVDPDTGHWRIHWMDSRTPRFGVPYQGGFKGDRGEFTRTVVTASGTQWGRIVFERRDEAHVSWSLSISTDDGAHWRTLWLMEMHRQSD